MKNKLRYAAFLALATVALSALVSAKEIAGSLRVEPDARTMSLLKAVSKDFDSDDYMVVSIETTMYLLKGGKIVKTKKIKRTGGFSGGYALVDTNASNLQMQELAQGGQSVWKKSGATWRRVASNEGDWQCDSIKSIPRTVRRALRIFGCN